MGRGTRGHARGSARSLPGHARQRNHDDLEVGIDRVVPGGSGLGRVDGRVALVSGGLPGDRVRARLSPAGTGLLLGELVEVLEAGPARRPPSLVCPRALDGTCGG
ncbi:MAG TPA: TRAM domain-containing protein, partial [Thermoanaerobaculia bacterium]|nr:TRAM domain-containing protein [Thermoanaerobaculia bacterium]